MGDKIMNSLIKQGIQKAAPIGLGYFPLGLAFGVIAQDAGLTIGQVGLMSLLIFSGSGQFIAVALMIGDVGFWGIIATIMLVNSRYMLFSAALTKHIKRLPRWAAALVCQGITDETFVVASAHFQEHPVDKRFWLPLNITSHLVWISSTMLGTALGNFIPNMELLGLNFALPAMFIALFFMTAGNRKALLVGLLAGIVSVLLLSVGVSQANVILATIAAATVGVALQKWIPG